MINKKIHWCWFGPNELSDLSKICIKSWKLHAEDFDIIRWSEPDINNIESKFLSRCLSDKMWAYASDYVRLYALYYHGGVYLDTDMELVRNITPLLDNSCFLGMESENNVSAGIIGSVPGNKFIKQILDYYDSDVGLSGYINIPMVITSLYDRLDDKSIVRIYEKEFFYPYNPYDESSLKQLTFQAVKHNTFAIHHWEKKWKLSFLQRLKRKLIKKRIG